MLPLEYVKIWRPKYIRKFREPFLQYVMDNSSGILKESENEPVMLRFDGHYVKLNLCGLVVGSRGQICDQYVRVAHKIYEKQWERQFVGKSKRFMLDPAFAMMILACNGRMDAINTNVRAYSKRLKETVPNRVNVVFVPVLREGHWWCAAFSMNREEVIIIDSIETKDACDSRSVEITQLATAMDVVF